MYNGARTDIYILIVLCENLLFYTSYQLLSTDIRAVPNNLHVLSLTARRPFMEPPYTIGQLPNERDCFQNPNRKHIVLITKFPKRKKIDFVEAAQVICAKTYFSLTLWIKLNQLFRLHFYSFCVTSLYYTKVYKK